MNLTFEGFSVFFKKYAESIVARLISITESDKNTRNEYIESRTNLVKTLAELRPDINIDVKFREIQAAAVKRWPKIHDVIILDCLINYFEQECNKLGKNEYVVEEYALEETVPHIQKHIYDITNLPDYPVIIHGKGDDKRVVLDYDRSIDLSKAIIFGDFDCSKQKAEFKFPTAIRGKLICRGLKTVKNAQGQKISAFADDFIIPELVTGLDCSHSCIDLEKLSSLELPKTLKTIIIEHSFINQVAKNPESLSLSQKFIKKHPKINVVSDKNKTVSLAATIAKISVPKTVVKAPILPVQENTARKIQNKTEEDLNSNDILARIDTVFLYKQFAINEDELKRQIRASMKLYGTYDRQHNDGTTKCINISQLDAFVDHLMRALQNSATEKTTDKTEQQTQSKENKKTPVVPTFKNPAKSQEKPIVIKKYISKNVWNTVKKACGKDIAKQKSVLRTICSVNLDPRITSDNSTLQILDTKTHTRTICSFLEKKGTQCVTQSIDTPRLDRKRLVWTYLPENQILVCTGYFSDHQGANRNEYVSAECNAKCGKDITNRKIEALEIIQCDKYYDAAKLLEEFETNEIFAILQKTDITDIIAAQIVQRYTNAVISILDKEIKKRSRMLQSTNTTENQQTQTTNIQKLISAKKQIEQDITKVNFTVLAGILKGLQYN